MYRITYTHLVKTDDHVDKTTWNNVVFREKDERGGFPFVEDFHIQKDVALQIQLLPPGASRLLRVDSHELLILRKNISEFAVVLNDQEMVIIHKFEGANFVEL